MAFGLPLRIADCGLRIENAFQFRVSGFELRVLRLPLHLHPFSEVIFNLFGSMV
jgi:hypothetical protein